VARTDTGHALTPGRPDAGAGVRLNGAKPWRNVATSPPSPAGRTVGPCSAASSHCRGGADHHLSGLAGRRRAARVASPAVFGGGMPEHARCVAGQLHHGRHLRSFDSHVRTPRNGRGLQPKRPPDAPRPIRRATPGRGRPSPVSLSGERHLTGAVPPGRKVNCWRCRSVVYVYAPEVGLGAAITLDPVFVVGLVGPGPGEGFPRSIWPVHRCEPGTG
jgi:hypothetical protein